MKYRLTSVLLGSRGYLRLTVFQARVDQGIQVKCARPEDQEQEREQQNGEWSGDTETSRLGRKGGERSRVAVTSWRTCHAVVPSRAPAFFRTSLPTIRLPGRDAVPAGIHAARQMLPASAACSRQCSPGDGRPERLSLPWATEAACAA